jgi:hypothetical protein
MAPIELLCYRVRQAPLYSQLSHKSHNKQSGRCSYPRPRMREKYRGSINIVPGPSPLSMVVREPASYRVFPGDEPSNQ